MIRSIRTRVGEHVDQVYYALLRTTVTHLLPGVVQFDEHDPILVAGLVGERREG